MTYLPDVNVWLAQSYTGHVHHRSARAWFEESGNDTIAFCRITQGSLLRLLTNRKVMGDDALNTLEAWKVYDALRRTTGIVFASEPEGLAGNHPAASSLRPKLLDGRLSLGVRLGCGSYHRHIRPSVHRGTRVKVLDSLQ